MTKKRKIITRLTRREVEEINKFLTNFSLKIEDLFDINLHVFYSLNLKERKIFVVTREQWKIILNVLKHFFPHTAGGIIGTFKENKFFPSLWFVSKIGKIHKKGIQIIEKNFIYGKDIKKKEIINSNVPLSLGKLVIVFDKNWNVLGLAKLKNVNTRDSEKVVAKNILDVGRYIRDNNTF